MAESTEKPAGADAKPNGATEDEILRGSGEGWTSASHIYVLFAHRVCHMHIILQVIPCTVEYRIEIKFDAA